MISDDIPKDVLDADARHVGPYFLWRLLIDRRFQGRGYGRATVDAVADYVRGRPDGDVLYTSTSTVKARPCRSTSAYGFVRTGRLADDEEVSRLDLRPRRDRRPSLSGPPIIPRGHGVRRSTRGRARRAGRAGSRATRTSRTPRTRARPTSAAGSTGPARPSVRPPAPSRASSGLVWAASQPLTFGLATATIVAGLIPAITAYVAELPRSTPSSGRSRSAANPALPMPCRSGR